MTRSALKEALESAAKFGRGALRTTARAGLFGPLPTLAYRISKRYPETTLPMAHIAAGAAGPVPAAKIALGERLPEREKYAGYRAAGGALTGLAVGGPRLLVGAAGLGGALGGGAAAIGNIAARRPVTTGVGRGALRGALYGLETSPTYTLTNTAVQHAAKTVKFLKPLTEKGIARTLPKATQTIGQWSKNLGKTGLKRIFKAALVETPIEGITYGIKEQKDKQKLLDSIADQTAQNFVYNIGFAGANTAWDARTVAPIIKKSFDTALESYKALPPEIREAGFARIPSKEISEGAPKVSAIPKELEPLAKEARKYKSVEDFRNALFPSGGIMDISNRNTQRFGRLISSSIKGEELPDAIRFSKELDFEWKDLFRQYGETPPDLSKKRITIWRAAPQGTKIEPGDWVALTKKYAESHLGGFGRNKLYRAEVSPEDIVNAGTDASEWFYAPKEIRKEMGKLFDKQQLTDFYTKAKEVKAPRVKATPPAKIPKPPEPKITYQDVPDLDVRQKANIFDYLRTPTEVLKKVGLEDVGKKLIAAEDSYLTARRVELERIREWANRVPDPGSSQRIFRFLDGKPVDLVGNEREVANEIKKYLADWADKLDLPEDKRIASYITHIFEKDFIKKEFDPALAKLIDQRVPGSVYDPFLEKRLGKLGFKEDVWGALDAYVKRATRKVNMDPALKELKGAAKNLDLETYKYVKRYGARINLRPTEIDSLVDNFIKQTPIGYKLGQRPVTALTRKFRGHIYRATLGLNLSSAIRNLSQGTNTYAKLGGKYTTIGYTEFAKRAAAGNLDELVQNNVLTGRFVQDRSLSAIKSTLQKVDEGLFAFFDAAEKLNRGSAYFGAKRMALDKGMSEAEAIKFAKDIVAQTQFRFGAVSTPLAL